MRIYVDLTHKLNNNISVFPDAEKPLIKTLYNVKDSFFKVTSLNFESHSGTHIDAPSHFIENGKNLDEFDVSYFFGKAYTFDCSNIEEITGDNLISIKNYIENIDYLFFFTGKQYEWCTEKYNENLVVLTKEAALWLNAFNLKGIGTDGISHDRIDAKVESGEYYVHQIFLSSGKILIENLTNLDKIKGKLVDVACLPIYYVNADGSPVRIVANFDV